MAALAALLLLVAWNMSEVRHFAHIVRVAPRSDVLVLLTCFALTVVFDMVVAVSVGVVLAALLFMRRMAEVSNVRLARRQHRSPSEGLPPGVLLYEIAGPLFFGAAQKAMSALQRRADGDKVVDPRPRGGAGDRRHRPGQPGVDGGALHQLGMFVVLGGVQGQPLRVLARSGIREHRHQIAVHRTMERALEVARERSAMAARARAADAAGGDRA